MNEPATPPTASNPVTDSSQPVASKAVVPTNSPNDFASQANTPAPSIFVEFIDFLRDYRAWWLTPLIIVLLLLAGLTFLSETALAPFIYPLW